jgi:uncharacterized protein involved in exopolysaccharide biosynthesis
VNIFIDYEVESKREDLRTVRNEIEKELDELSQKLRAADENISRFMQDNKIVSLENEISLSLQRIADLETKLSSQESKKADIQTRIREIETQLTEFGKSHLALPGIDVDKNFMKLQDELSALEEEKLKLISSPFRPGDEEKLLEIGRKIEGAKALISNYIIKTLGLSFAEEMPIFSNLLQTLTQYTTDSAAITAESDAIKRIISELSAGIKKLPVLDLELVRLTQDRDRIKSLYDERLKSALDLKITESFKLSEVRVVEPAKVPQYPDFPMMLVNGIIAVAVGVFISFFVVLFLEFVKNPVRSAEHAEEILGIKYLGSVSKKI